MTDNFKVEILKTHSKNKARILKINTAHGIFQTPVFMPVGTRAFVNCMSIENLLNTGTQLILGGNTYHMLVSPGTNLIAQLGGMHKFMTWSKPMLIDSGGFQMFSLSKNKKKCKIDENGAHFKHPNTGHLIHLTPQTSIETQKILGADIIMAFDQCTPDSLDKLYVDNAMQRTHRWLEKSLAIHVDKPLSRYNYKQAFFGIVQGAFFEDLRKESADFIVSKNPDGIAIGGETIGFDMEKTVEILKWIEPLLPQNKPRYTMGVGLNPQNLLDVVAEGADMFDCVAPTRNARHGSLYSGKFVEEKGWVTFKSVHEQGKINLHNALFSTDQKPIMETCFCSTCRNYSRAYLRFLLKSRSLLYAHLASIHNIQVMNDACLAMYKVILKS